MSVAIRTITVRDRKTVTQLFKKVIKVAGDSTLSTLISSENKASGEQSAEERVGETVVKIALDVLTKSIDILDEDITAWFADLIGVSVDEYESMPINTESDIFNQLRTAPEAAAFFTTCFAHAKWTGAFESMFAKLRTRFASIVDSEREEILKKPLTGI